MARIRNIKPEFFRNEQLSEVPFEARLLFAGLWTQADREGRLEDRPKRLKAELFPYDDVDVENLLEKLSKTRDGCGIPLIERYQVEGASFIEITAFKDHQYVSHKEPDSVIPPCPQVQKRAKPQTSLRPVSDKPKTKPDKSKAGSASRAQRKDIGKTTTTGKTTTPERQDKRHDSQVIESRARVSEEGKVSQTKLRGGEPDSGQRNKLQIDFAKWFKGRNGRWPEEHEFPIECRPKGQDLETGAA